MRIIHVMTHPPPYEAYAYQPRPKINWDTPDGSWVGIWGYDWADLLAIEVRKVNERIPHEIWQPDLRADKVYSKEIFPGVVHTLFPAFVAHKRLSLFKTSDSYAPGMLDAASKNDELIFHIGRHLVNPVNKSILENYHRARFVVSFHGQIQMPISSIFRMQKNLLKKFTHCIDHFQTKKLFKKISYVTIQNSKNLGTLKKYYKFPIKRLPMGIEFKDYPVIDQLMAREELELPREKKIMLTMSRLVPGKQIDKLIDVLSNIQKEYLLVILGIGEKEYEQFLKNKAEKVLGKTNFLFAGYKHGPEKVKFLSAADLFILVSKSEGSPVVVVEAMASNLPILTTDTGYTSEFLKKNNAGRIVGIKDYNAWQIEIENFLNGQEIQKADYCQIKNEFEWKNIAHRASEIYDEVLNLNP